MTVNLKRFVPFFLGLFISLCLSRWWSLRAGQLQGLLSAVGRLSFWLRATLPAHASWIRHRVERECMLAHKLVYLCAQDKQDSENLDKLQEQGFLSKEERSALSRQIASLPPAAQPLPGLFDFDLASVPFTRAAHLIYRVFLFGNRTKGEHGISIPPPVCVKLLSYCMDAWKCIENIEMTLSSPLPFPYFHLVCLLVHFITLCECVRAGIILGTSTSFSAQHVACEVFTTLAGNSLYCGMLCLAAVLTDPFGNDIVDFPCEMFQHRLWKTQYFASMLDDDDILDQELTERLSTDNRTATVYDDNDHDHDDGDDGVGHADVEGDDGE